VCACGATFINIGCSGGDGVDNFRPAVDADMSFHPKEPLVALLGLVHVRISALLLVLGRRRCTDSGRIDDRAPADLEAVGVQLVNEILKKGFTQVVPFEQIAEAANNRLVWGTLLTEVEADEAVHRDRIVQRFFGSRICQVEPLL